MTAHDRLWLLAPILLLAASCTSGAKLLAEKFATPSAVAAFRGFTSKHAGEAAPRPYVAVANLRRDELTLLDPVDNELVLSSTLSFPLSVPTRPRPFRLASAPLEADGDPARGADLLVVATQSPPSVQLVTTWTEEFRALDLGAADDLAAAYPGAAVLSLAAASRPGGGVWVFVGLSGGQLAVLEFERDPTSTLAAPRRPIVRTALPLQKKDLVTGAGRFDPLDLAVAPDASRLFVATADPLWNASSATVLGVGQLTVVAGSAASTWPVVGLDARAPTRLVAAGSFAERTLASAVVFQSTPTLQVFAVLDEQGCGPRAAIDCGLVTLLPDTGIAPDPSGELTYRAPIGFARPPAALALVMPRKGGDTGAGIGVSWLTAPTPAIDLMTVATGAPLAYGQTALLVVATADGVLHAVDPGRWTLVNALQSAEAAHRKLVASVSAAVTDPADVRLALWNDATVSPTATPPVLASVAFSAEQMNEQVRFTQGYLPTDTFVVAWQGALPQLAARTGMVQLVGDQAAVAIQTNGVAGAYLDDPELAVHVNDLVRVQPASGPCGGGSSFLATVTAIRARDTTTFPGGALLLSHGGSGVPPASLAGFSFPYDAACPVPGDVVGAGSPGPVSATLTVLASGLVLTGKGLGYLGRPETGVDFQLQYQSEAGLSGEALAVARKLRRRFYPADAVCGTTIPGTEGNPEPTVVKCENLDVTPRMIGPANPDPLVAGPMLRFRLALGRCPIVDGTETCTPCDAASTSPCAKPGAGATLTILTSSGLTAKAWASPATQGVATGLAWLDARTIDDTRSSVVYASFATNEVLSLVPSTGAITSIR